MTEPNSHTPDTAELQRPDVRAIMMEIRGRVAEKRKAGIYPEWPASLERLDLGLLSAADREQKWALLDAAAAIDLQGEPIKSHRPISGFFIKALKRFTRFWIRKYTDPIFLRQSMFNAELLKEVRELRHELDDLRRDGNG